MIKGDRKVRKYLAIGHFKENKNITCVVSKSNTLKEFRKDLCGNEFIPYVVITEKMMKKISELDCMDLFDQVKKMTSNYRVWNDVADYIEQCCDIMQEKFELAK
jgi:hypothetical protein